MNSRFSSISIILFCVQVLTGTISIQAQGYQTGNTQITFTDASRNNRSIAADIYYPSLTQGANVSVATGVFPVVVFGHGFVMTPTVYDVVWNALVPEGYVVVLPSTEGSFSPSHTDFGKDLAFLTGAMKNEGSNSSSLFFSHIAAESAVMGHSMGGGSAFLAVQYDSTITAMASLAAANTNPSSITAASGITIPTLVIAGANDCVAPPSQHQLPMYNALASNCKTYVSITGASHCQFASFNFNCTFGESTCSPQAAISSSTQQSTTGSLLTKWFDFYLKNSTQAGIDFQNLFGNTSAMQYQQNCNLATAIKKDAQQAVFQIKPQPASDMMQITSDQLLQNAEIVLFDASGRQLLKQWAHDTRSFQIECASFENGLYTLVINNGARYSNHKIIILK